jgi:segregation and condensation protein A
VVSADYTVRLAEVFQGPMDLLLHLVREQEVEIHQIEINRVIDGYLAYLRDLEQVDIDLAGDFVLMAATLMAIKSRSLLPREEIDLEAELDPRDELIQRLIEYRHFKEASRDMSERLHAHSLRYTHSRRPQGEEEESVDFGEITQWDLLSCFSRLMREIQSSHALRIQADDRPLRWHVERLVGWLKARRVAGLRELVQAGVSAGEASKPTLIGTFCALLELMKIGVVRAEQAHASDDIRIALVAEAEGDLDLIVGQAGFDDERPLAAEPENAPETHEGSAASEEAPDELAGSAGGE